jgi:hypothetical protein
MEAQATNKAPRPCLPRHAPDRLDSIAPERCNRSPDRGLVPDPPN